MKKLRYRYVAMLLCSALLLTAFSGCATNLPGESTDADAVQITVWTYYNGSQLDSFNELVDTFNETTGKKEHIFVTCSSQGSVSDLETNVMNAALGKVGADPLPNIFSAYADNAYAVDELGMLVDLSPYITAEERNIYIQSYLSEGDFSGDGSIKIFPIAKATELLFLNDTDWQVFARATGASYEDLSTVEGLLSTAELYYQWTDAQTAAPDDGRAFFGRDSMANYILDSAEELKQSIFLVDDAGKMTINFDRATMRTLWDAYYVPYIKGWFRATGRFRSDDIKTGNILAYVGSSSSGTYFPDRVVTSDTESHEVTMKVLQMPHFSGYAPVSPQQGAGMAVTRGTEEEVQACITFLKWFTSPENSIAFTVNSGYLPVVESANRMEVIQNSNLELDPKTEQTLAAALQTVNETRLFTSRAFSTGQEARNLLDAAMSDQAAADRAIVEERMAQGQRLSDAAAEFLTEEHFETWYQDTLVRLQALQN